MSTITLERIARARQLALRLAHGNEAEAEYHLALAVRLAEVLDAADEASASLLLGVCEGRVTLACGTPVDMEHGFSAS